MNSIELSELYKIRFAQDQLPRKNAIWQVISRNFLQRFIKTPDIVVGNAN
jgi:hypothetical protein